MENNYKEIIKHIPSLEDHGHRYMYYGVPCSEECDIYGDEEDNNLIVSYECNDLCEHIAEAFQYDYKWHDILQSNQIMLEDVFKVEVETQNIHVIASLLLYLVVSITFEDKFINALNNGYMIRLLKRLAYWN